jgi:hypothetical protein
MINTNMRMSSSDRKNLEKIYESMTSGDVYGGTEFDMGLDNKDWYAPGDARNPYGLGITTRHGKLKPKRKKKKKVAKKKDEQ